MSADKDKTGGASGAQELDDAALEDAQGAGNGMIILTGTGGTSEITGTAMLTGTAGTNGLTGTAGTNGLTGTAGTNGLDGNLLDSDAISPLKRR